MKTSYATIYKQWHRPLSKRFIRPPYSTSRVTPIDSKYCHLLTGSVLSKKETNHAPISFDEQVQISHGHTL